VSWFSRLLRNVMDYLFGKTPADRKPVDPDATAELPVPTALTLVSGALKLQVGVISTVGHYREHNEDNFYVPGRRTVRHDAQSTTGGEGSGEVPASSFFDPSNVLFIVADGMGGQQAGEQASKMAVDLIPKAIAKRLPSNENDRSSQP
jgi:serine/threonine protein phosphatase PrpC